MPVNLIWISYDLGVRGDYENLYAWLDAHEAKECGDSVAVIKYQYKKSLFDEVKADLAKNIEVGKATRIYVVYRDRAENKFKGKFAFGGRRAAPWTGYSSKGPGASDDEI